MGNDVIDPFGCVGEVVVFQFRSSGGLKTKAEPPVDPHRFYRATIAKVIVKDDGDVLMVMKFITYHHGGDDFCPYDRLGVFLSDLVLLKTWPI